MTEVNNITLEYYYETHTSIILSTFETQTGIMFIIIRNIVIKPVNLAQNNEKIFTLLEHWAYRDLASHREPSIT